jgi:ethanolamine ammonia-lyase small subunit
VHAFRDLIPHFEVQVRTALLQWRAAQKAEAEQKFAGLQASLAAASDALTKSFAEDALRAAEAVLQAATVSHQVEQTVKRTGNAPDEEAIELLKQNLQKKVDSADAAEDDPTANEQNL